MVSNDWLDGSVSSSSDVEEAGDSTDPEDVCNYSRPGPDRHNVPISDNCIDSPALVSRGCRLHQLLCHGPGVSDRHS